MRQKRIACSRATMETHLINNNIVIINIGVQSVSWGRREFYITTHNGEKAVVLTEKKISLGIWCHALLATSFHSLLRRIPDMLVGQALLRGDLCLEVFKGGVGRQVQLQLLVSRCGDVVPNNVAGRVLETEGETPRIHQK